MLLDQWWNGMSKPLTRFFSQVQHRKIASSNSLLSLKLSSSKTFLFRCCQILPSQGDPPAFPFLKTAAIFFPNHMLAEVHSRVLQKWCWSVCPQCWFPPKWHNFAATKEEMCSNLFFSSPPAGHTHFRRGSVGILRSPTALPPPPPPQRTSLRPDDRQRLPARRRNLRPRRPPPLRRRHRHPLFRIFLRHALHSPLWFPFRSRFAHPWFLDSHVRRSTLPLETRN